MFLIVNISTHTGNRLNSPMRKGSTYFNFEDFNHINLQN